MDAKELIGVTLGTCTLERVIGQGGMGAVYLAQQARPVRTVAVKVLIPSDVADPDQRRTFLERFRREADTIAKLDNQNILPIYEYDEAYVNQQQLAYLVMPFIRGGTLRERMDEMKRNGSLFDLQTIASYLSQVADALSYAHSFGVIHRDVKPANLLFHQDGRLLLSDFGIVRLRALPSLTNVGSFLGTAEYASPEQVSSNDVDYRTDIYSLGTILYELLTGSVPFTGPNPFVVMTKKLQDAIPSIRISRPDLSPAIDAIVQRALARNPMDRYQAATLLASDFKAAINALAGTQLHLGNNGGSSDLTIPEQPWSVSPIAATVPAPSTNAPSFPAQQAAVQAGMAPWQQPLLSWQAQANGANGTNGASAKANARTTGPDPNALAYRQGHRLFFYGSLIVTLLLQVFIFAALTSTARGSPMLGVLLGSALNLLLLAAIGFTGVVRDRKIGKFVAGVLIDTALAFIVSGLFIGFGNVTNRAAPIVAYIVLLVSNLYALRQVARVDAAKEQIRVAPVLWRPALLGALTGLLPLAIILTFVLTTLVARSPITAEPPMIPLLRALFVVFIGIPTPGAVLAVKLSRPMRFASLLRSSAISGMLMCAGALLLVVLLWLASLAGHSPIFALLSQTWPTLLLMVCVLGVLGALRGMLDTWIYRKISKQGN